MGRWTAISQNEEAAWSLFERYEDPEHTWFRRQGKPLPRLWHTSGGEWTQSRLIMCRFDIDEDYEEYATGSDSQQQKQTRQPGAGFSSVRQGYMLCY